MKNQYIYRIKQVYPGLVIEKAEKNDIGQNNDVIMINDSLVNKY